jgi:hypothetical protein
MKALRLRSDQQVRTVRSAQGLGRPSPRCSQHLARPRSRDSMRRGNGARPPSKRAQRRRSPARCAASRSSSVDAGTARCTPKARREHGLHAIAAAREALAAQTALGNDPRRRASVNRARGEAVSEVHRRNRSWAREHPDQRDEAWFRREVLPKLDGFTLREIADATGLSLAACSRIRAGARVPHPRHWEALLAMLGGGKRP